MATKKICLDVDPLMGRKHELMNDPAVKEYLDIERRISAAKKVDVETLVALRVAGEIPDNERHAYGNATVYFKTVRPVRTDRISDALLVALVEYNPDAIRDKLTEAIIEDAIKNAAGRRTESAKRVQGINLNAVLGPVEYKPQIGENKGGC